MKNALQELSSSVKSLPSHFFTCPTSETAQHPLIKEKKVVIDMDKISLILD
jgi:hypothetical protein